MGGQARSSAAATPVPPHPSLAAGRCSRRRGDTVGSTSSGATTAARPGKEEENGPRRIGPPSECDVEAGGGAPQQGSLHPWGTPRSAAAARPRPSRGPRTGESAGSGRACQPSVPPPDMPPAPSSWSRAALPQEKEQRTTLGVAHRHRARIPRRGARPHRPTSRRGAAAANCSSASRWAPRDRSTAADERSEEREPRGREVGAWRARASPMGHRATRAGSALAHILYLCGSLRPLLQQKLD